MLLEESNQNSVGASCGVKEDIKFYEDGRWLQEGFSRGCSLS